MAFRFKLICRGASSKLFLVNVGNKKVRTPGTSEWRPHASVDIPFKLAARPTWPPAPRFTLLHTHIPHNRTQMKEVFGARARDDGGCELIIFEPIHRHIGRAPSFFLAFTFPFMSDWSHRCHLSFIKWFGVLFFISYPSYVGSTVTWILKMLIHFFLKLCVR